jgi:ferric-dicitrate binding protein FerR (iron transport regulator)
MSRERLKELWSRFVGGGGLPPEEERELTDALGLDEALRDELLQDVEIDGLLRVLERAGADAEAFKRSFFNCLDAERDKSRFIRKVESRIDAEPARGAGRIPARATRSWVLRGRTRGGPNPYLIVALTAAGMLFALVIGLSLSSSGLPRNGAERIGSTRPRPEANPPAPEETPPAAAARPEAARKAAEERLAAIERERERVARERQEAERAHSEELRRKAEEAFRELDARWKEAAAGLARAREEERRAKEAPGPAAPRPEATKAAVAALERVEGEVHAVVGETRHASRTGAEVLAGQGIETGRGASLAVLRFADGTRLELGAETAVRKVLVGGEAKDAGKWIDVARGSLEAEVPRQPAGRPLVIATPHAEATVLGTTLRLTVDAEKTRLEVEEGRVRLKALHAPKSVEVTAGHFAVAGAGVELAARPTPVDEILLLPRQGIRSGGDWRLVEDPKASTGWALEAPLELARSRMQLPSPPLRHIPSYVTFKFRADANKDYSVWIRGLALPTKGQAFLSDAVLIEIPQSQITQPNAVSSGGPQSAEYNGFVGRPGYWWLGGWDQGAAANTPVTVRFARSGTQALRMYLWEGPVRIDAIWLSTAQKTRPDDTQFGPKTR